jgi:S1-C subfamily serine protease
MSTSPRVRPALAAVVAALALALSACGSDGSATDGSTVTTTSTAAGAPTKVAIQTASSGFDAQQVYAESAPSVVTILSVLGDANTPLSQAQAGQGSGFVLNEDGEIATNAHVVTDAAETGASVGGPIKEASEVYVEFGDRNQVPADIIGFDPNADVALIKVDPTGLDLQPIPLGDSDGLEVGQPVAAIGSPFGETQSLSTGIISATDRSIDSLTKYKIDGAIQTDASINPGNSGGPLIGADGKVIGIDQQINTTSGGNEGVGFAVPINLVKSSLDQLRATGEAKYPYIGVSSQALYPQLADKLGIDAPTGSLISDVLPGSPAADAGLKGASGGDDSTVEFQGSQVKVGGDVITAVDGEKLVAENDLSRLIAEHQPGDKITLQIIRDGEQMDVDVTLGTRPGS